MRDFNYAGLVTGDAAAHFAKRKEFVSLTTPGLLELGRDYSDYIERSASFSVLPVELVFQAVRNARMTANAIYKTTGKAVLTLIEQMDLELTPEMRLEFSKEAGESERLSVEKQNQLRYSIGLNNIELFLGVSPHMRDSIDALYTSLVLEAWAYLEALLADTWCAAVDVGTPTIAANLIRFKDWESDKDGMKASNLPAAELPNAQTKPGSFRRELGLVSFQRLRSIRKYYEAAFGKELESAISETADGYIIALSEIRNCILHRGGKADDKFVKAIYRFEEWRNIKRGERLLLSGEMVRKLVNVAQEVALHTLKRLDEMLIAGV